MNIDDLIKEFIAQNLLFSDNGFNYPDDTSFLEEGIIDSVGVLELIAFVEEQFDITVDDLEVTPDNFDSVTRLTTYIQRKQGIVGYDLELNREG